MEVLKMGMTNMMFNCGSNALAQARAMVEREEREEQGLKGQWNMMTERIEEQETSSNPEFVIENTHDLSISNLPNFKVSIENCLVAENMV